MNKITTTYFYISQMLLAVCLLFLPSIASAQGFVTCEGASCSACNLVETGNLLLVWLIGVAFVFFAVIAVVAGFGLVTSGGNSSALQAAKDKFVNAFIGLIIVLAAWILVDTIMVALLKGTGGTIEGFGVWAEVDCQVQNRAQVIPAIVITQTWFGDPSTPYSSATVVSSTLCGAVPAGNVNCSTVSCPAGTTAVTDTTNATNHYVNCVQADGGAGAVFAGSPATACTEAACVPMGIPCKSGANCNISPSMVNNLNAFHAAAGVSGARVTEGYPPTRTHKSQCHYNGTCIDYSKAGGMTSAEVLSVHNAAVANGLRPVYEVGSETRRQELIAGGVPAGSVKNYGSWISGEHFSIYGY